MSKPPEYENGAPSTPPNVFLPRPTAPPPVYEEFTDPAAAHGWESGYDETVQLPPVVEEGAASGGARRGRRAVGAGRGSRRKAGPPVSRRVLVLAGAVGAVSAAALIGGVALNGSEPADDTQEKQNRTSPTAPDLATPTEAPDGDRATPRSSGAPSQKAAPNPSASPSGTQDDDTDRPSPTPSTTGGAKPAPTATAPTTPPNAADDKPGRGLGNTKRPR
ncbi:hypothetical protein [Streptomyces sp. UG1]|uniref:hypothetical protein n=1 Tax=Streptomyces sp. UG1 TaxID=3417652 RepID=UPI003CEC0739